jgi:hypothetical protein
MVLYTIRFRLADSGELQTVLPGCDEATARALSFILGCSLSVEEGSVEVRPLPKPYDLIDAWRSYREAPLKVVPPPDEDVRVIRLQPAPLEEGDISLDID